MHVHISLPPRLAFVLDVFAASDAASEQGEPQSKEKAA
jgi:hypothetical protein